ncbi:g3592 [Coccomyxa viridis]|uniref:G3592 protein n=1 Tax=Coccomyxa viridis TaxID=1274662 RepID=A0ABP1FTI9_9CHLO
MPVRDEDASDIFSELVPQVLRSTEDRNEVTNRLRQVLSGWRRASDLLDPDDMMASCPASMDERDGLPSLHTLTTFRESCAATPASSQDFSPPEPCSYLRAGQVFCGNQRVNRMESSAAENWLVEIQVQDVDLRQGMAWGTSSWLLPNGEAPVETTWQGEIIDNCNHTFDTQKWGASHISDMKNWSKFSAFSELYMAGSILGSRCCRLKECSHIFMRWKEQAFAKSGDDCGLTIAGFYYICLCRQTGDVEGFYVDPLSLPNHKLTLKAVTAGAPAGMQSFAAFQFR